MRRVIAMSLVTLGVTSSLSSLWFFDRYSAIRPTSPRPEYAQIIQENNKGHIFFVSKSDEEFIWHLQLAGIILAGIGGLLLKEKYPA